MQINYIKGYYHVFYKGKKFVSKSKEYAIKKALTYIFK